MITCRFSRPSRAFANPFKKLSAKYKFHRERISSSPALRLPLWNAGSVIDGIEPLAHDRQLVIIGIGGATQGAKAVLGGMRSTTRPSEQSLTRLPRVVFLDNFDPDFVFETLGSIDMKRAFFVIISKSGETLETLSIAKLVVAKAVTAKQMLFISDLQKNTCQPRQLEQLARKMNARHMHTPRHVPGRFSVFSEVGLIPLRLAGIDISALQQGARAASRSTAYRLACMQALHYRNGKNICVLFSYASPLDETVTWYIQLLGESIGKSKRIGITPLCAHGTRDQHSLLQLFLDGPDDKFYIFLKEKNCVSDVADNPKGNNVQHIFDAQYTSVLRSFENKKKPFVQLCFDSIDTYTIGHLLFLFELQIAFLGSIFEVDVETQPAVEESKRYAKRMLKLN